MDIQERLTAFAMLGATWVMWLLVALSVIGLAIILERVYYFVVTRSDFQKLRSDLLKRIDAGKVADAKALLKSSNSVEAKVAMATLRVSSNADSAEERMAAESGLAKLAMERNLAFLGTVGNNAPFVGLLGTVIGIIRAFHELESSGGQVSAGLMAEIGEALVATAIGLLVALPAVAFFNLFTRVIRARLTRADSLGRELLALLKAQPKALTAGAED